MANVQATSTFTARNVLERKVHYLAALSDDKTAYICATVRCLVLTVASDVFMALMNIAQ